MEKVAPKITFRMKPADEMILGAYVEPLMYSSYRQWGADVTFDEAVWEIKNSGMNTLFQANSRLNETDERWLDQHGYTMELLDATSRHRLNLLFKDAKVMAHGNILKLHSKEEAYEYFKKTYGPFWDRYDSFAGLHFVDEPGYKDWVNYAPIEEAFNEAFPDKLFFLNLLQTYAPHWAFPNGPFHTPDAEGWLPPDGDVNKYYQSYVDTMKPTLFAYDHYPIRETFPAVEPDYFYQLHLSKEYAKKCNAPILAFIQVGAWGDRTRVPTDAELRWQVNCAIAYNTKHLGYYTYWMTGVYPHHRCMMVDEHGNKTKQWFRIKQINKELLFQDEYFLNAAFNGYIQVGKMPSSEMPVEADRLKTFGNYKDVSGGNLFIGCFDYVKDDKRYNMYYVVNNDLVNEVHETFNFKKGMTYTFIHRDSKVVQKSDKVQLSLTPGDACIIIEGLK